MTDLFNNVDGSTVRAVRLLDGFPPIRAECTFVGFDADMSMARSLLTDILDKEHAYISENMQKGK